MALSARQAFPELFARGAWHDRHMQTQESQIADHLGRLRCEQPQCLFYQRALHGDAGRLRQALRRAGVPALEMNAAPLDVQGVWLAEAYAVSAEFLVPVVIFSHTSSGPVSASPVVGDAIRDLAWLDARQVALTRALDHSTLNQEWRRSREKTGWVHVGWQEDSALKAGNGLQLAWSSPLPLRRVRDFAARCPDLTLFGPDIDALVAEIAAQGISPTRWRFAVK